MERGAGRQNVTCVLCLDAVEEWYFIGTKNVTVAINMLFIELFTATQNYINDYNNNNNTISFCGN